MPTVRQTQMGRRGSARPMPTARQYSAPLVQAARQGSVRVAQIPRPDSDYDSALGQILKE